MAEFKIGDVVFWDQQSVSWQVAKTFDQGPFIVTNIENAATTGVKARKILIINALDGHTLHLPGDDPGTTRDHFRAADYELRKDVFLTEARKACRG